MTCLGGGKSSFHQGPTLFLSTLLLVGSFAFSGSKGCAQETATTTEQRSLASIFYACTVCHGLREMQRGPILEGLESWYLAAQLRKFRVGLRGKNPENRSEFLMGSAVSVIQSEQEIEALAVHISRLLRPRFVPIIQGDATQGRQLYAQHCASCHGSSGEGWPSLKAPKLVGLEDWYVLDQLRKFQNGQRAWHAEDLEGRTMANCVQDLAPFYFRDIAASLVQMERGSTR